MTSNAADTSPHSWRFLTPLEPTQPTLDELLRRAWPEASAEQRADLLERGLVMVEERVMRDARRPLDPDDQITFSPEPGREPYGLPEAEELARGPGWVLVNKPTGMPTLLERDDPMNPVLFMADMLGMDRDGFTPAMSLPTLAGGPWLCGETEQDAERLMEAWRSGKMMLTFLGLTPRLERPRGALRGPGGLGVTYAVTRNLGALCEIQIIPEYRKNSPKGKIFEPFALIRKTLAQADIVLLGDRSNGGYMVDGGLRLRLESILWEEAELGHSWNSPDDWWPEARVRAPEPEAPEEEDELPFDDEDDAQDADSFAQQNLTTQDRDTLLRSFADVEDAQRARNAKRQRDRPLQITSLRVSPKTIEVMEQQGHPWVLADAQTSGRAHLKPGSLVALESKQGMQGPWALVEGTGELAARRWAAREDLDAVEFFSEEVNARVDEAIIKRSELLKNLAHTNLFRLIHGEADGLPGLLVDRVGGILRATLTGESSRIFRKIVYENLLAYDPKATLIEVWHTEDVRQRGELPVARLINDGGMNASARRTVGLEDDLKYWCEPWEGIDVGFFADQRENRRRLRREAAPGQRWLNLFGHTGAFSVALARQGAAVVNVDVSRRYLEWTRENFLLNHIDPSLDIPAEEDARTYVKRLPKGELFDGIIVDPPTAAHGKAGFWSVRKDYAELLSDCLRHLRPGAPMLVCRNDRKGRGLDKLIEEAAQAAGITLSELVPAPPGLDYPHLEGFPEGDPFDGFIARRKA